MVWHFLQRNRKVIQKYCSCRISSLIPRTSRNLWLDFTQKTGMILHQNGHTSLSKHLFAVVYWHIHTHTHIVENTACNMPFGSSKIQYHPPSIETFRSASHHIESHYHPCETLFPRHWSWQALQSYICGMVKIQFGTVWYLKKKNLWSTFLDLNWVAPAPREEFLVPGQWRERLMSHQIGPMNLHGLTKTAPKPCNEISTLVSLKELNQRYIYIYTYIWVYNITCYDSLSFLYLGVESFVLFILIACCCWPANNILKQQKKQVVLRLAPT